MRRKMLPIFVFICVFIGLNLSAFINFNDIECVFNSTPEKPILKENMVNGAIHFLYAKSHISELLAEYEKSAKDKVTVNTLYSFEISGKAIEELKQAIICYSTAKQIGENIGYNSSQVDLIKAYNYDQLKQGYNAYIAGVVIQYLKSGDVIGLYQKNLEYLNNMLNILETMEKEFQANSTPNITAYWKLVQLESEATLFGNTSTVFGLKALNGDGSGEQCK